MTTTHDRTQLSQSARDFIDSDRFHELLADPISPEAIDDVIAKSMQKEPLTIEETAALLKADDPALIERIFDAARQLKRDVYGNRIVLFAPLYIGNACTNDCSYCGFRRSNPDCVRRTLSPEEIRSEVAALENVGHKRLMFTRRISP